MVVEMCEFVYEYLILAQGQCVWCWFFFLKFVPLLGFRGLGVWSLSALLVLSSPGVFDILFSATFVLERCAFFYEYLVLAQDQWFWCFFFLNFVLLVFRGLVFCSPSALSAFSLCCSQTCLTFCFTLHLCWGGLWFFTNICFLPKVSDFDVFSFWDSYFWGFVASFFALRPRCLTSR